MASSPKHRTPTTHESLLVRLQDWDDHAGWREFFETYWNLIYSTARRAGLADAESQDVVQETILHIAHELRDGRYDRNKGSFRHYLFTAATWKIRAHFKQSRRQRRGELVRSDLDTGTDPLAKVPDPNGDALETIWEEEWTARLQESALARLKRRVRPLHFQIFESVTIGGRDPGEVAREFGVSRTTVYVIRLRLTRLLKQDIDGIRKGRW